NLKCQQKSADNSYRRVEKIVTPHGDSFLRDGCDLVDFNAALDLNAARRPSNSDLVDGCCRPETEVLAQIALRQKAAAALDLTHLRASARPQLDPRADGGAIRSRPAQLD